MSSKTILSYLTIEWFRINLFSIYQKNNMPDQDFIYVEIDEGDAILIDSPDHFELHDEDED